MTTSIRDITENRRAEEELRVLKDYLDAILLNLPVGLAILEGPDFRFFRINKKLADLNGLPVEDHLGRPLAEILPDSPNILSNLHKVRDEGRATAGREFSTRLPSNPDQELHLMDFHFPILVGGETRAVGAVVLDITARREAEEALRVSKARYHDIFETTPVSIWEEDYSELKAALNELKRQGVKDFRRYFDDHPEFVQGAVGMFKILDVNQQTLEMFGARSKDQLLESLERIFVPETLDVFREELIAVADGARYFEAETLLQTLDGEKLNVLLAITYPEEDSQFDHVLVSVVDITARKRAEEALLQGYEDLEARIASRTKDLNEANAALRTEVAERKSAQRALQRSEEHLRLLLETTNAIPWTAEGKTFRITYVGPQAGALLGYPINDWFEPDFWPDHIHPDDRQVAVDFFRQSSRSLDRYELEYRMISADGQTIWVHHLVSVVRENGEVAMLRGFMNDVTERKRAEDEALRHREELARVTRVATMGELATSLAHELNQPLASIVINAQAAQRLLTQDDPHPEEVLEALADIVEDGKRGGAVIHGLRRLLGQADLEPVPLEVNQIICDVLTLLRGDAVIKNIELKVQLAADLPLVEGDPVQLQQVVINLLLNGSEAMSNLDAPSRELMIRAALCGSDFIEVAVRDSGVGLHLEDIDRIFEAFFTTKPSGMGMGLSISRRIVETHGGRLWAEPNPDRGATFRFTLPVAKREPL